MCDRVEKLLWLIWLEKRLHNAATDLHAFVKSQDNFPENEMIVSDERWVDSHRVIICFKTIVSPWLTRWKAINRWLIKTNRDFEEESLSDRVLPSSTLGGQFDDQFNRQTSKCQCRWRKMVAAFEIENMSRLHIVGQLSALNRYSTLKIASGLISSLVQICPYRRSSIRSIYIILLQNVLRKT